MSLVVLCRRLIAVTAAGLCLTSCIQSTYDELLRSRIALHERAIEQSRNTLGQLQSGGAGQHQFRIFIANDVVNRALAVLDGRTIRVPDQPDIVATLRSARLSQYGSLPAVTLIASARRGSLTADVTLTAILLGTEVPGEMRLGVVSFVPDIRWGWLELTKARFVRDLLAVNLDRLSERLPAIRLPIERQIALGGPAYSHDFRFKTSNHPSHLTMRVAVPSTQWRARLTNFRYFFVRDGIYLFGDIQ